MTALNGKAVVITGAGAGLGAAYARHAADLGASIVVNDRDATAAERVAAELTRAGRQAIAHPGDISSWSFAGELIEACVARFGAIDGLVNNAGVLRPAELVDMSEADLRLMLDVNVVGSAACAAHAARRMTARGRGSIVNITSGSHAGDAALGGYAASKGAIASFTYSWAIELANSGVRVNAVSPLAQTGMSNVNTDFRARQNATRPMPIHNLPAPEVSAPAVSYLLSDDASDVNGQIVRITGSSLSIITHPMIAAPVLDGEWTFAAIKDAFATTLKGRQRALGLARADA